MVGLLGRQVKWEFMRCAYQSYSANYWVKDILTTSFLTRDCFAVEYADQDELPRIQDSGFSKQQKSLRSSHSDF